MTSFIEIELPWPPTVNHYWIHVNNRKVMGKKGIKFRAEVCNIVNLQFPDVLCEGRLVVGISAYPPDRRKRDLDNLFKATLDALEHAKLYLDDNQIDVLSISRKEVIKGGKLIVGIRELTLR